MTKAQINPNCRLRIAFAHIPGNRWSAGQYYLKNLFFALRSLDTAIQPEILLFVPNNITPEEYNELAPYVDEVLQQPAIERKTFFVELFIKIQKLIGLITGKEHPVSALLKKNKVDVFFTLGPPPSRFSLPFLSWIPDFQHLHYPDFFSEQELQNRNTSFERSARDATLVILSSHSALDDYVKFTPWAKEKARILSFVAQIPAEVCMENPEFLCKKYNIPKRFILLSNQFWKHKNHETVIYALQRALKKDPELTIICTGNTTESRDSEYFKHLLRSIAHAGVQERMVVLGLIPRQDLFCLMHQAMAVLQPSFFEGWNTTIEEVKSLGKQLIASDIPVHREQNAPGTMYFKPTDAQSLAILLVDVFTHGSPGLNADMAAIAKKSLASRTKHYGNTFLGIAQEATKIGQRANTL
ncbi:MAG: glycosyltransferase family 4 protein [Desulfobacterales bacterium]|nr:glycosyltransferase family 4 protein [Desulfobacterales bacterium]